MGSVRFQPPPPSFPCPGGLGVYLGALLHGWGVILGTLSTNQPGSASSSWLAMFPPPRQSQQQFGEGRDVFTFLYQTAPVLTSPLLRFKSRPPEAKGCVLAHCTAERL